MHIVSLYYICLDLQDRFAFSQTIPTRASFLNAPPSGGGDAWPFSDSAGRACRSPQHFDPGVVVLESSSSSMNRPPVGRGRLKSLVNEAPRSGPQSPSSFDAFCSGSLSGCYPYFSNDQTRRTSANITPASSDSDSSATRFKARSLPDRRQHADSGRASDIREESKSGSDRFGDRKDGCDDGGRTLRSNRSENGNFPISTRNVRDGTTAKSISDAPISSRDTNATISECRGDSNVYRGTVKGGSVSNTPGRDRSTGDGIGNRALTKSSNANSDTESFFTVMQR